METATRTETEVLREQLAAAETLNEELARKNETQRASLARLFLDLEQLAGELQDARQHDNETTAWAHNILREVGKAHNTLAAALGPPYTGLGRASATVLEALGHIVDPTSADLGEPS